MGAWKWRKKARNRARAQWEADAPKREEARLRREAYSERMLAAVNDMVAAMERGELPDTPEARVAFAEKHMQCGKVEAEEVALIATMFRPSPLMKDIQMMEESRKIVEQCEEIERTITLAEGQGVGPITTDGTITIEGNKIHVTGQHITIGTPQYEHTDETTVEPRVP
jgi:hypothetical protein